MAQGCLPSSGGKGNRGRFIERSEQRICAAGVPTKQPYDTVAQSLQHYLLKDEVDSLLSDTIFPPKPPLPSPPLRHPLPRDKRYAGPFGDVSELVNPPDLSKFQSLVEDLKQTPYQTYWRSSLGEVPDPVPMFPEGYDIYGTKYGIPTPVIDTLYGIVMPKDPLPNQTPPSKLAGVQTNRNYCRPAFNPDLTYGYRSNIDKRGIYAKCNLTNEKVIQGTAERTVINFIKADQDDRNIPRIGRPLTPNDNIKCVPEGYAFGKLKRPENLPECLTTCKLNPGRAIYMNCLAHLNSLRKILTRKFLPTFFRKMYTRLKYYDCDKSGWIPKQTVYNYCGAKLIRFDPKLIEPLLSMWNAFDGSNIEYKTFCHILNFKEPLPELPKVPDVDVKCLDFRTTYGEMTKPDQEPGEWKMAGAPSGRYFDLDYPITPEACCKADRTCLPQESDMNSCLKPSIFTLVHVNHREMYAKREPQVVRRVFEAAGDTFTDEKFEAVWQEAKKHHSQGWVCYETFRRALDNYNPSSETNKE